MKIHVYNTYRFKDKDPVIDEMRTMQEDSGMSYEDISVKSGVSKSTQYNWFHGKTRRPQSATVEAFGRALGFKRVWANVNGADKKSKK
jgi:transcriptional regulator with XRE-family HTH domain